MATFLRVNDGADDIRHAVGAMIIFFVCLLGTQWRQPFPFHHQNVLESCCLILDMVVVGLGLLCRALQDIMPDGSTLEVLVSLAIIGVGMISMLGVAVVFVYFAMATDYLSIARRESWSLFHELGFNAAGREEEGEGSSPSKVEEGDVELVENPMGKP